MYAASGQFWQFQMLRIMFIQVIICVVMLADSGKPFRTLANEGQMASKTALIHKAPL